MRARRFLACALPALAALAAGCGGADGRSAPAEPAGGSADAAPIAPAPTAADRSRPAAEPWIDPEPAGAQALAESVVADPSNRDKTTTLQMHLTTIVSKTTRIGGDASALAARATSVEDRLSRLGAEVSETEITIRLPGSILFDFDSANLRPDAERTLEELAQVLIAYAPRPASLVGHTDSIASDAYNQSLSERRARSVESWLAAHGVAADRLRSSGRGESQPAADNSTPAGRQLNRRVEVIIARSE